MLYAHGPDLCHESDLRHAMANAFEAMMAAIYLDAGIDECDRSVAFLMGFALVNGLVKTILRAPSFIRLTIAKNRPFQ